MLPKLKGKYEKWGLTIKISKTDYRKVGYSTVNDIQVGTDIFKGCHSVNYLGVTLSLNGRSVDNINNRIGQGKQPYNKTYNRSFHC